MRYWIIELPSRTEYVAANNDAERHLVINSLTDRELETYLTEFGFRKGTVTRAHVRQAILNRMIEIRSSTKGFFSLAFLNETPQ